MHTNLLHRIAALPVIREVLGACFGGAIAMSLYYVFEFVRSLVGDGVVATVAAPLHGAALLIVMHGTVSLGLSATLALAGTCAFLHRRMISEID